MAGRQVHSNTVSQQNRGLSDKKALCQAAYLPKCLLQMAEKNTKQKSTDKRRACGMDKGIVRITEWYPRIPSDDNNR